MDYSDIQQASKPNSADAPGPTAPEGGWDWTVVVSALGIAWAVLSLFLGPELGLIVLIALPPVLIIM